MPSCAFPLCRNHSRRKNKSDGITFHSFPENALLLHKWLIVVRRHRQEPDWTPNKHSRICSVHFKSQDIYTTNKGYKKLSKKALPFSQFCFEPKPKKSKSSDGNTSNTELAPEDPLNEGNNFLERKIERVIADKRKVIIMNKNLKRQNKRLIDKCTIFKGIVNHLKETVRELESKLEQLNK